MKADRVLLTVGRSYCCYLKAPAGSDCFLDDACFDFYLRRLLERGGAFRLRLHAYCLLPNEAFLLFTPITPFALSDCLKSVNACYGDYFRERYRRPARVFPRLRAVSSLNSDAAFLDCQKYLEREGARRFGLTHPGAYHWSSYSRHAFTSDSTARVSNVCRGLSAHKATRSYLGAGAAALSNYREFIAKDFSASYFHYLSVRLRYGKPIGSERLIARKAA